MYACICIVAFVLFFGNSWLNYYTWHPITPADNSGQAGQAPGRCLMAVQGRSGHKADHSTD